MGKITLVLGGVRSGKSEFAEKLAADFEQAAFVGTAQALDDEMRARIKKHRERRPPEWRTFEQPFGLDRLLGQIGSRFGVILVDCICLYVKNLLLSEEQESNKEGYILLETEKLCKACREAEADVVIVSSEVGAGGIPEARIDREYQDILGLVNQRLAECADEVFCVVAGLPIRLKGQKTGEL